MFFGFDIWIWLGRRRRGGLRGRDRLALEIFWRVLQVRSAGVMWLDLWYERFAKGCVYFTRFVVGLVVVLCVVQGYDC